MRIERLDLSAYGPFTDLSLEFGPHDGRLCIVHGPNEAGKSSALRAIGALLFGVPHQTPDDFLHPYQKLRLGALLRDDDGTPIEVVRLKRRKHPLRGADDQPLDEAVLQRLLPGLDHAAFIRRHGIDHVRLREGGDGLLQSAGEVGETLFAAGAGLGGVRALLSEIDAEADQLWLPRGRNQEIATLVHRLQEHRTLEAEVTTLSTDWARLDQERRDIAARRAREGEALRELRTRRAHHERLLKAVPLVAEREATRAQIEAAVSGDEGGAPAQPLPPDYDAQLRFALTKQLAPARARLARLREARAELQAELAGLEGVDPIQAHLSAIESLVRQLPQHLKAKQDLRIIWGRMKQREELARGCFAQIRPGLTAEEAEALKPTASEKKRLQALGRRHHAVLEAREAAQQRLDALDGQLARHERALERLGDPQPLYAVEAAVAAARADGPLESQRQEQRAQVARRARALEAQRSRLSFWKGPLEPLLPLPLPTSETLERFERAFDDLADQRRDARRQRADLERRAAEHEGALDALSRAGAVVTEADLIAARQRRDAHLGELQGGGGAWGEALGAVGDADAVADRLRREARRVEQHARLTVELETTTRQLGALDDRLDALEDTIAKRRDHWRRLWLDLAGEDLQPGSPREMRTWCGAIEELRRQAEDLDQHRHQLARVEESVAGHLSALAEALGQPQPDDGGLERQLKAAELRCGEANRQIAERRRLEQLIDDHRHERAEAQQALARAEEALERWQQDWAEVVSPLDLPATALPEQADAVLEALDEAFGHEQEARSYMIRVRSIEHDERKLTEALDAVLQALAPTRVGESPSVAVPWLEARAAEARQRQARRDHLIAQRETLVADEEALTAQIDADTDQLQGLCAMVGVDDPGRLAALELAAEYLDGLQTDLQGVDSQLRLLSAGAPLTELVAEVQAQDADALEAELKALDEQIEETEGRLRALDEALGATRTRMEAADNQGQAAEAHERAEGFAERIRNRAEQYARLRMSATLLRLEIEAHRARTQGPILNRAGAIFTALTGGSFSTLTVDYNNRGEPFLQGLRSDGQRLGVEGMSEGSRDQLYLALRLAFLERGLDGGPRIPFVVDDILVHFDDRRSTAALKVLGELAQKTQIIFFTHHQHLLDVARDTLGAEGFTALHLSTRQGDRLSAGAPPLG